MGGMAIKYSSDSLTRTEIQMAIFTRSTKYHLGALGIIKALSATWPGCLVATGLSLRPVRTSSLKKLSSGLWSSEQG